MARPNTSAQRKQEFLPIVAAAFAQLGYRRTTTAELAARLDVRENVLYRLWADKKAMFLDTIRFIYEATVSDWQNVIAEAPTQQAAATLLAHAAQHHGETGLYRIVFAGLSETDDPDIRKALRRMFKSFQEFIVQQIQTPTDSEHPGDPNLTAWAFVSLGIMADLGRELRLFNADQRKDLLLDVGSTLLP